MFVSIRKYSDVKSRDEAMRRVEEKLVPVLRGQSGFISYYLIDFEDGDIGSVSVWGTQEDAHGAADTVRKWVTDNLSEFLPNEPTAMRGKVLVHETVRGIGQAQ